MINLIFSGIIKETTKEIIKEVVKESTKEIVKKSTKEIIKEIIKESVKERTKEIIKGRVLMITLKKKAYNIIKENIITCKYAPGELLNETQLMEEVGASRTPIREALSKLEQEKLVKIFSKKGIMVSELTMKEIGDVYQVRLTLEPEMIRLFGNSIPIEKLEECRNILLSYDPKMDVVEKNYLDDLIHRLIIDNCPNSYMNEWMTLIYGQNQRLRIITGQLNHRMEKNTTEHREITEAMLRSDFIGAAELMYEHLDQGRKSTFDFFLKSNGVKYND